jgi:hypothetical protein
MDRVNPPASGPLKDERLSARPPPLGALFFRVCRQSVRRRGNLTTSSSPTTIRTASTTTEPSNITSAYLLEERHHLTQRQRRSEPSKTNSQGFGDTGAAGIRSRRTASPVPTSISCAAPALPSNGRTTCGTSMKISSSLIRSVSWVLNMYFSPESLQARATPRWNE